MNRVRDATSPSFRSLMDRLIGLTARVERALATSDRAVDPGPGNAPEKTPGHPFPEALDVLVVDDDPAHRAAACELLDHWGIKPILAADGAEAVAVAAERKIDLILMDLQMPVLDGLGATKQIRRLEEERRVTRVPVVAYTSCLLDADLLRDCGVDDVLQKPCSASELQQCLQRWCAPDGAVEAEAVAVNCPRSAR
jgi:CheY-like chemotaxis protein